MQAIPETHVELLLQPNIGILTTIMSSGLLQSSIVWCDWDGTHLVVNTTKERQKGINMLKNPKVSLIVIDPSDSSRWISIQGLVEIETDGAIDNLNKMTQKYTKYDKFYGNVYPEEQQYKETRIKCKINPIKIFIDAIHK